MSDSPKRSQVVQGGHAPNWGLGDRIWAKPAVRDLTDGVVVLGASADLNSSWDLGLVTARTGDLLGAMRPSGYTERLDLQARRALKANRASDR
jgi:hypothetical protein